jgi:ornithine carbamoyltransferase
MGEEAKIPERIKLLKAYRVTSKMMAMTGRADTIFLHCLPCFHDEETELARKFPEIREATDDVFEGTQSRVFDQAENRVHTIKAMMIATMG